MLSKALFLNLGSMTFGAGEILCLGAVLPGLYLLDASACLLPCGDQQKYHQTLPNGWGEVGRTNFPSSQFTTPVLDSRKKDAQMINNIKGQTFRE